VTGGVRSGVAGTPAQCRPGSLELSPGMDHGCNKTHQKRAKLSARVPGSVVGHRWAMIEISPHHNPHFAAHAPGTRPGPQEHRHRRQFHLLAGQLTTRPRVYKQPQPPPSNAKLQVPSPSISNPLTTQHRAPLSIPNSRAPAPPRRRPRQLAPTPPPGRPRAIPNLRSSIVYYRRCPSSGSSIR
jgi:hypothetical protein